MKNSMIVIPILILQLFTGFTLISIKHYDYKQLWVQGSTIGFMIMLSAWFVFVFCALKSKFKTIQFSMLIVTFLSLLSMIYLMANRI